MLNYVRQGQGKPLVFIHGFLGSKDVFQDVIDELAQQYDIIRVELPGHGDSVVEKEQYSIYDYVDAVIDVLKHEGISKAAWLGHSLGGYITLAALETKRFPITKAILAYSSASTDDEATKEKRDTQAAAIQTHGVKTFVDNSIAGFFAEHAEEHTIEKGRQEGYRASENGLLVALEAMKERPDQRDFMHTLSIPTLVLEGKFDQAVKPIETNNAVIQKVITDMGHLGMLEDPQAFIEAVKDFLG